MTADDIKRKWSFRFIDFKNKDYYDDNIFIGTDNEASEEVCKRVDIIEQNKNTIINKCELISYGKVD